ncbi:MAG: hypothetical protein L0Z62_39730 [Gemmataceae bacterium]|nr:hypothetical protein [Gemmataceae bacterium]
MLQITGDSGDNQFAIAPAPTPGQIRISGAMGSFTSINGAVSADFALSAITDITILLESGQDNVTVRGFSIPGDLTILYGNRTDSFSVPGFTANNIHILFSGPGSATGTNGGLLPPVGGGGSGSGTNGGLLPPPQSNTIDLTGVKTGALTISTGWHGGLVSLSASTIGTASIVVPGLGINKVAVLGSAIGKLMVTSGDGNDDTIVAGCRLAQATLTSGKGEDIILVTADTFASNSGPPTLHVAVGGSPYVQAVTLAELVFNTNAPNLLPNGSLSVRGGDAIPVDGSLAPSTLTLSQITGVDAVSIRVGGHWNLVSVDTLTARSLTTTVGDNTATVILDAITVAGPVNVTVGANAQRIQGTNIVTSVTPTDLALGRLADVSLSIGNGAQSVTLNAFRVGRNLTITNGAGDTTFMIGNGQVGKDMTLTTGNGRNALFLNMLRVVNCLFAQAGSGVNSVAAAHVTCGFGTIAGGSGLSNVYWDQGGNAGFDVIDFAFFLP